MRVLREGGKAKWVTFVFPINVRISDQTAAAMSSVAGDGPSIVTTEDPPTLPGADRPGVRRTTIRIEPAACRPYRRSDWEDCLVVIESGSVDLDGTSGIRQTFHGGDVLWLVGLSLRGLVNRGDTPVVITTVRRR